jgi:DNA-binding transcriptional regulator YdaS (Cro superfamily)
MQLYEWYKINGRESLELLAVAVEKSPDYLSLVARGHRKASHTLAKDIERETDGLVSKHDLRPDIFGDKAA